MYVCMFILYLVNCVIDKSEGFFKLFDFIISTWWVSILSSLFGFVLILLNIFMMFESPSFCFEWVIRLHSYYSNMTSGLVTIPTRRQASWGALVRVD